MEEKIFDSHDSLKFSGDLMSFDGCPNRCTNGYYVDPYLHKRVRCEHCFELRKKLVVEQAYLDGGKRLTDILRLQDNYTGNQNFDVDALIPKSQLQFVEPRSVEFVKAVLRGMVERVSLGEKIMSSVVINLGRVAHSQLFIAPFLMRSYVSGLSTVPFITALDVVRLRSMQTSDNFPSHWLELYTDLTFDDLLESDTCLVYIDAGDGRSKEHELMAVKGLMQLRAWNGRSTIILTDYWSGTIYSLTSEAYSAEFSGLDTDTNKQSADAVMQLLDGTLKGVKDLAVMVSVRYKKMDERKGKEQPKQSGIQVRPGGSEISQQAFQSMLSSEQSGVAQYNPR